MTRKRAITSIIRDETQETQLNRPSTSSSTRKRSKFRCYCSKCNGNFVDSRTKEIHDQNSSSSSKSISNRNTNMIQDSIIQENEFNLESVIIEPSTSLL